MTNNFKKLLTTGTTILALSAIGNVTATSVKAADVELTGGLNAPNDLSAVTASENILNKVENVPPFDSGELDVDDGVTVKTINSDFAGTLSVYDSASGGDRLTVSDFADVAPGTTLVIIGGNEQFDGSGTAGAADITVTNTLGEDGGSTLTRGGTLRFLGAQDTAGTSSLAVNGDTLMTGVSIEGGQSDFSVSNTPGQDVTATFGDAGTDTFDTTGFSVEGGSTDILSALAGGSATARVNGPAFIGSDGLNVTGGTTIFAQAKGGLARATFANTVTITGGQQLSPVEMLSAQMRMAVTQT